MITNLANAQRRALMGPLGKTLGLNKTPQRCKSQISFHPFNLFSFAFSLQSFPTTEQRVQCIYRWKGRPSK